MFLKTCLKFKKTCGVFVAILTFLSVLVALKFDTIEKIEINTDDYCPSSHLVFNDIVNKLDRNRNKTVYLDMWLGQPCDLQVSAKGDYELEAHGLDYEPEDNETGNYITIVGRGLSLDNGVAVTYHIPERSKQEDYLLHNIGPNAEGYLYWEIKGPFFVIAHPK